MINKLSQLALVVALGATCCSSEFAFGSDKNVQEYTDYRNEVVRFPLGAVSFADRIVSAEFGTKRPLKSARDPLALLGEPDYKKGEDGKAYTLGCKGSISVEFTDNALIDGPGDDLYVFEVGPDVEPTEVALSNDGVNWIEIGQIEGGKASLDLAERGLAGQHFRFVRLTDTGKYCQNRWPGADIDAIGAISSALRLQLESKVLFEFDKAELKPEAGEVLRDLADRLNELDYNSLSLVGHTDSRGSDAYNQDLSERRAKSVAAFLVPMLQDQNVAVLIDGKGEKEAIADNDTDEGRAQNRRVEIIVVPK